MNTTLRIPLRALLTVPYVLLIAALAGVVALLSYQAGRDAVDTWSDQLLVETVERIKQAVDRHVAGSAAVLEAAFPRGVAAPASLDDAAEMAALRTRFWLATSVHRDPNNYAYFGDTQGRFFGLMRHSESEAELRLRPQGSGPRRIHKFSGIQGALGTPVVEERIFEPRERPWFKAAQSNSLHTWTSIYIDFKTEELVATRARRVVDGGGQFAGVVATDLSLRQIDTFVRKLALSTNGVALVVEGGGLIVGASRGPHLVAGPDGKPRRLAAAESPEPLVAATYKAVSGLPLPARGEGAHTAVFAGPDGQAVQVGFSQLRDDAGLDWLVMVAVPRHDFLHRVESNVKTSIALGLLAMLATVGIGWWVLSTVARELRGLARAAARIGAGDLETPLPVRRSDELGQLAQSFNDMQRRLLTDALTGLSNREAITRRIERRMVEHRRQGDARPFVLLFVDLNEFKQINDRFGHEAGDRALRELSARIRSAVRAEDMVARWAGDEFAVLLDPVDHAQDGDRVREHLQQALRERLQCLPADADVGQGGAAIGLAVFPDDGRDLQTLLQHADADMYRRKNGAR